MNKLSKILLISLLFLTMSSIHIAQASEANQDSVLVQMFEWWNQAFKSEQPFTEEGFSQYFTDDIVFVINNKASPKGIKSLTERFNKIKNTYHVIEIVLPLKEEFSSVNRVFTYHLNRGKDKKGDPWGGYTHVMGWVDIKNGKIDYLNFLHYDEDENPQ
jgi:ketosteroid isomerase-like protein